MLLQSDEMKFTVLYTLREYENPITLKDLSLILTWEDRPVLEFFELSICLGELLEDGYVRKTYTANMDKYCLTGRGEETCEFFASRVPASIREKIDSIVGSMKFEELVNPNRVVADILPLSETQYMAKCQIIDNKTPLLELNLYVGTKDDAEKTAKYFEKNAKEIYSQILKICGRDFEKDE